MVFNPYLLISLRAKKYPDNPLFKSSAALDKLVAEGNFGRKSGKGFYDYKAKKWINFYSIAYSVLWCSCWFYALLFLLYLNKIDANLYWVSTIFQFYPICKFMAMLEFWERKMPAKLCLYFFWICFIDNNVIQSIY